MHLDILKVFKNLILELAKKDNSVINNNNTNCHNTNNNTFNLNMFLNEKCKDAINIDDFVSNVKMQLTDLENFGYMGYVEGVSRILIKNLKDLDTYSRPIHCADLKREIIYIKENDVWTKENADNKRLKKSIKDIAFRNCRNFHLFKEKHPECVKSDSIHSDQYLKIVAESIGGKGVHNIDNNDNKIIKKIAKLG